MPKTVLAFGSLLLATLLAAQTTARPDEPMLKVSVQILRFNDTIGLPDAIAREITRRVTSQTYGSEYESAVPEIVHDELQRHGYFKAIVSNPRFTVLTRNADSLVIEASVAVVPGDLYYLRSIEFPSATVFPYARLRGAIPIHDGDVLDVTQVRRGIRALKDLYCSKGFVNFTPIPDFTFRDPQSVDLRIDIDEGAAYRVGNLSIDGEESVLGAKQRLLQAWQKYQGTYRCNPVADVFADLHARPNLPLDQIVSIQQDNNNHLLNYRLTLGKPDRIRSH